MFRRIAEHNCQMWTKCTKTHTRVYNCFLLELGGTAGPKQCSELGIQDKASLWLQNHAWNDQLCLISHTLGRLLNWHLNEYFDTLFVSATVPHIYDDHIIRHFTRFRQNDYFDNIGHFLWKKTQKKNVQKRMMMTIAIMLMTNTIITTILSPMITANLVSLDVLLRWASFSSLAVPDSAQQCGVPEIWLQVDLETKHIDSPKSIFP